MQGDRTLSRPQQMLLALVRGALWDTGPSAVAFEAASPQDWEAAMRFAAISGVTALAFHSAMRLPETLRPPRSLRLSWGVSAEHLAYKFSRQQEATGHLTEYFASQGMRTMLLKGLGLALYYPRPELRECGDIDIWLYGDYEKGNRAIRELGIPVDTPIVKHSNFTYEGVPVENHRTFLDETLFDTDLRLDRYLEDILRHQPPVPAPGQSYLLPPADFNALFLVRHAAIHFTAGIVLRHAADWACFLHAENGRIDAQNFNRILRDENLKNMAGVLTAVACLYLGMDEEKAPCPYKPYEKDAARVLADMMKAKPSCPHGNPIAVLAFKTRNLFASQWRHRLVYGRFTLPTRIWSSVISHLKKPHTIFKVYE